MIPHPELRAEAPEPEGEPLQEQIIKDFEYIPCSCGSLKLSLLGISEGINLLFLCEHCRKLTTIRINNYPQSVPEIKKEVSYIS